MAAKSSPQINSSGRSRSIGQQFRSVERNDHPSLWPSVPRYALLVGMAGLVALACGAYVYTSYNGELETAQAKEETLRAEYKTKVQRAVSLSELKKQREQVLQYVTVLEKQLPGKAEMDKLLSDINQAGLGRSLQFELFRPGDVVPKEYYAERPIKLRVSGLFHDIGAFTADIAGMSRIVTLNNIAIAPSSNTNNRVAANNDVLVMDAVVKTFRYLDPEEVAAQRAAAKKPGG